MTGTRDLPLGCYGKLPFWRCFLERGVGHDSIRKLKRWIDDGRRKPHLGADAADDEIVFRETRACRFLLNDRGARTLVAGVLRPSQDSESRPFPFALFVRFSSRRFRRHYALLPCALEEAWRALDDALGTLASAATKGEFDEILDAFTAPSPSDPRIARARFRAWAGGGSPNMAAILAEDDGSGAPAALASFVDAARRAGDGPAPAARLPLGPDVGSHAFEISAWIDHLSGRICRWPRKWRPSILWPYASGGRAPDVVLVGGYPGREHYSQVICECDNAALFEIDLAWGRTREAPLPVTAGPSDTGRRSERR
ncbi:MAG: type VI secretion system-associated protein TagF [Deltaproteobacteria bacterium]|nr:MAG: type VI secretion system-associated protein TagF [Deltaproteobacteria bacterium]